MATSGLRLLEWRVWRQPEGFSLSGLRGTARASRVGGSAMPGACALLRFDHQLEVGRSWAKRPHAAASRPLRLRSFGLRAVFCDFLAAGTGSWARSVVAGPVDAVTAGANASSRVVCGELDRDAESCRLTGALIAGEGGETIVEGIVLGLGGAAAIVLGLGGMAAIVLRLWETVAITDLPSPSWPAICTTTPLALAIDPHTSAAEAAPSGRD